MQDLDTNVFEIPETPAAQTIKAAGTVTTSSLITRESSQTQAPVQYVRLSDAEHRELTQWVDGLNSIRQDKTHPTDYVTLNNILDANSKIWGSRLQKFSTLREVLEGVTAKLAKPHKYVRGRRGEDLSVKQLTAINVIIAAVGGDTIAVPTKEA